MGSPLGPPGPPTTIPGSSIASGDGGGMQVDASGDGSGVQEDAGAKAAPTSGAPQTPAVVGTTEEIKFKPPPPLPPHFMPGGSPPTASGDGCQEGEKEVKDTPAEQLIIKKNESMKFNYGIMATLKKELKAHGPDCTLSWEETIERICYMARYPVTIEPGDW